MTDIFRIAKGPHDLPGSVNQADYGRRGKLGNSGGIELGVPAESGHQGRHFC